MKFVRLMPFSGMSGVFVASVVGMLPLSVLAAPKNVSYSIPSAKVEAYDDVEITATVESTDARNPFQDATLTGTFEAADGSKHWSIDGFCDSMDGSIFRIRFMPPQAGQYKYSVTYRQGEFQKASTGTFLAHV